jgi:hypothetical protein
LLIESEKNSILSLKATFPPIVTGFDFVIVSIDCEKTSAGKSIKVIKNISSNLLNNSKFLSLIEFARTIMFSLISFYFSTLQN